MKKIIFILLIFLLSSVVFANGLGVSPSKINFENLNETKQIRILNPTDQPLFLTLASDSTRIEINKERETVGPKESTIANISLDLSSCPDPGFYESIILIKENKTFGTGIAIKATYEIKEKNCQVIKKETKTFPEITGSVIGAKEDIDFYFLILIALIIVGYVIYTKKYRLKK